MSNSQLKRFTARQQPDCVGVDDSTVRYGPTNFRTNIKTALILFLREMLEISLNH